MKCPKCKYVSHDYLESCRKCGADLVAFKQDMGLVVRQPGVLDLSLVLSEAGADDLFASVEEEVTLHTGNDDDLALSLDDDVDPPQARPAPEWAPRSGVRETAEALTGLEPPALELDMASRPTELAAHPPAAPTARVPETVATPTESSEMAESVAAERAEGSADGARGVDGHAEPSEVGEPVNTPLNIFELSADDLLFASQADAPSSSNLAAVEPPLSGPALPGRDDPALGDVEASTLPGDLSIDLSPPDVGPEQSLTTPDALALEELDALLLPEYLTLDLDAAESMAKWASTALDEVRPDDPPGDVQSHTSPPQSQADDEEDLLLDLDEGAFDDDAQA